MDETESTTDPGEPGENSALEAAEYFITAEFVPEELLYPEQPEAAPSNEKEIAGSLTEAEKNFSFNSLEELVQSFGPLPHEWERLAQSVGGDVLKKDEQAWAYKDEQGQESAVLTKDSEEAKKILEGLFEQGHSAYHITRQDGSAEHHFYFADHKGNISYEVYREGPEKPVPPSEQDDKPETTPRVLPKLKGPLEIKITWEHVFGQPKNPSSGQDKTFITSSENQTSHSPEISELPAKARPEKLPAELQTQKLNKGLYYESAKPAGQLPELTFLSVTPVHGPEFASPGQEATEVADNQAQTLEVFGISAVKAAEQNPATAGGTQESTAFTRPFSLETSPIELPALAETAFSPGQAISLSFRNNELRTESTARPEVKNLEDSTATVTLQAPKPQERHEPGDSAISLSFGRSDKTAYAEVGKATNLQESPLQIPGLYFKSEAAEKFTDPGANEPAEETFGISIQTQLPPVHARAEFAAPERTYITMRPEAKDNGFYGFIDNGPEAGIQIFRQAGESSKTESLNAGQAAKPGLSLLPREYHDSTGQMPLPARLPKLKPLQQSGNSAIALPFRNGQLSTDNAARPELKATQNLALKMLPQTPSLVPKSYGQHSVMGALNLSSRPHPQSRAPVTRVFRKMEGKNTAVTSARLAEKPLEEKYIAQTQASQPAPAPPFQNSKDRTARSKPLLGTEKPQAQNINSLRHAPSPALSKAAKLPKQAGQTAGTQGNNIYSSPSAKISVPERVSVKPQPPKTGTTPQTSRPKSNFTDSLKNGMGAANTGDDTQDITEIMKNLFEKSFGLKIAESRPLPAKNFSA